MTLKLNFRDHGIPILSVLFVLDIFWVLFCLTGMLDPFVKPFLIIMYGVLLGAGNASLLLFLIYQWWNKNVIKTKFDELVAFVDDKIKKNVRIFERDVLETITKVEQIYDHVFPHTDQLLKSTTKFFQNVGEWDSEDEGD